MRNIFLLTLLLTFNLVFGQSGNHPFITTKKINGYDNKIQFRMDNLPELLPIPGAVKKPEVKHLWLFGDGEYSFEDNPVHTYDRIQTEPFDVECFLTYTYTDDEQDPEKKKRRRKKTKLAINSFGNRTNAPASAIVSSFNRKNKNAGSKNAVYLQTNQSPKAGEEFVAILSYRNTGTQPLNGKLKLFYNDYNSCPDCFTLPETPKSYNEEVYYSSDVGLTDIFVSAVASTDNRILFSGNTGIQSGNLLKEEFASRETWEINNLESGKEHHIFIILKTNELKTDTSLTTPVLVRFEGLDGRKIDDYELELRLVSSHDPNNVVAANHQGKMERSFDLPWKKRDKILYRINFQNNGDGAASDIKIVLDIPPSFDTSTLEILKVGIGKNDNILDGNTRFAHKVYEDSLVFFIQNISLGGTGQTGVKKKASSGFITFNIKTKKARRIVSQASIYFDTNDAVITKKSRIKLRRSSRMTFEIGVQQPRALADWSIPSPDFSFDNKFIGIGTSALLPRRKLSLDASIRYSVEKYELSEATAEFQYQFKHLTVNLTPQIDVLPFLRIGIGAEAGVLLSAYNNGFQEFNVFDQTQQDERYGPLRYGGMIQILVGATKKQGFALGASFNRFHDEIPIIFLPFTIEVKSSWHNVLRFFVRYKI